MYDGAPRFIKVIKFNRAARFTNLKRDGSLKSPHFGASAPVQRHAVAGLGNVVIHAGRRACSMAEEGSHWCQKALDHRPRLVRSTTVTDRRQDALPGRCLYVHILCDTYLHACLRVDRS